MYYEEYEKALHYANKEEEQKVVKPYEKASLETIKNLVSNEKPHEIAHILADVVEENDMPTLAKYVRKAGEDADNPNNMRHLGGVPFYQAKGVEHHKLNRESDTDKGLDSYFTKNHNIGEALSGIRLKIGGLQSALPEGLRNLEKLTGVHVSHIMRKENNKRISYLNIMFKRHDGSLYHIKHASTPEEHREDLHKMVEEGIPGAEEALR